MRVRRRAVITVGMLLVGLAGVGCAGGEAGRRADVGAPVEGEPGAEVILRRELVAHRQYVYYRLKPDGVLIYTAGRRAMRNEDPERKPTWRGLISSEARARVLTLARTARGEEAAPESESAPTYRLTVREPGDLWPVERACGPTPTLEGLYRALLDAQQQARPGVSVPEDSGA